MERFDSLPEAMANSKSSREGRCEDQTDMAKAAFGFGINGREFDVIHVKNNRTVCHLILAQKEGGKQPVHG